MAVSQLHVQFRMQANLVLVVTPSSDWASRAYLFPPGVRGRDTSVSMPSDTLNNRSVRIRVAGGRTPSIDNGKGLL